MRGPVGLVLCFDLDDGVSVKAWPVAERHIGVRVHVVGAMTDGPRLIATSIFPLG